MEYYLLWNSRFCQPKPVSPPDDVRWSGPWGYRENGDVIKAIYVRSPNIETAQKMAKGLKDAGNP